MMREGKPYIGRLFLGLFKQKNPIIGTGFSGKIEAIGSCVKTFDISDMVYGESVQTFGANAQYICLKDDEIIIKKPLHVSYEIASTICDGTLTSYCFLTDIGKLKRGQKILINGASGSLGSAAIQIARYLGAHVTGVCSTDNVELVKSFGAHKVIDYTKEDFTCKSEKYDIIYDSIGVSSFCKCKKILTKKGVFLSPVLRFPLLFQMLFSSKSKGKKAIFSATGLRKSYELINLLKELKEPIDKSSILPYIDKSFKLDDIVKAHTYVDKGHKKGNVVITF